MLWFGYGVFPQNTHVSKAWFPMQEVFIIGFWEVIDYGESYL